MELGMISTQRNVVILIVNLIDALGVTGNAITVELGMTIIGIVVRVVLLNELEMKLQTNKDLHVSNNQNKYVPDIYDFFEYLNQD
ncbi:MAG: hypothetical protein PVF83_03260 [Anaerolineales bacterium]